VERNEMSTVAVIVLYAEAVMTRYDTDQDGVLTNAELEAAVPIFSGFIQKIARDKIGYNLWDFEARGAFLYIMDHKALPGVLSLPEIYLNETVAPKLAINRLELAKVFKAIIGSLMSTGAKKPPAPPPMIFCHGFDGFPSPGCYTRQ
jgi:hypothetical protein